MLVGCNSAKDGRLDRLEFDNGDTALALKMSIAPHGEGYVVAPDATDASKALLEDIRGSWPELWPKMIAYINEAKEDYNVDVEFDSTFMATLQELEADVFMAGEADLLIGIHPSNDAVPVWHFFVRGTEIAHQQPVF